jgi:prepilin-type N-terminal cleavage/methylation domain-containing protein
VIFYKPHREGVRRGPNGFTLVEAVVAVALIGIGVAGTLTALTQANSVASMSRNSTGAQTAAQNQIDLLLSDAPFNPQKTNPAPDNTAQIPPELTLGTHTYTNVAIYKEPTTGVIVSGTMTTTVADVSPTYAPTGAVIPMYRATVTITYTYLKRNYTMTASTLRVSDI